MKKRRAWKAVQAQDAAESVEMLVAMTRVRARVQESARLGREGGLGAWSKESRDHGKA